MLYNLLSNFLLDLRSGLRLLRRHLAFSGVAVLTLALGIGANTAMFATIHAAVLRPLPYEDPGRLVLASVMFGSYPNPMASAPDYYDYREQADTFEALCAMMSFAVKTTATGRERPERVATTLISDDFFRMLGVRPVAGRWFTPEEGTPGGARVLMIGERFARRWFGSATDAVGRPLTVNGAPLTVVGVMPAGFRLFHDVDIWVPMRRGESVAGAPRRFHNWLIVGRLKAGVSIEQAQRQVDVISKRLEQQYPDSNKNKALDLSSLQSAIVGRQMPTLMVLMAAVGLVLLIACGNVAGLLLARGAARRPELALRSALGASRSRLAGQLLIESAVLAVGASVLGVLLAYWLQGLMPIVAGLQQTGITIGGLSRSVLLFALGLSALTGLLFGVAPALRSSALNVAQDLTPGARATETRGGMKLRSVLVAGQVAVSLMLLVTAGLLIRSFVRLATTDPGYVVEHLLTGEIQLLPSQYPDEGQRIRFFDGLREDLLAAPGVTAVGFTSHLPVKQPFGNVPVWAADNAPANPAARPLADRRIVLPGYFDAVGIPLVAGRDLSARDRSGAPVALVVSELMARTLFPGRSPLGQCVMIDNGDDQPVATEVVGVVGDARVNDISQPPRMTMYLSYYQSPDFTLRLAIRTGVNPDSMVGTIRRIVAARDMGIPVENLVSMEQLIGDSVAPRRVTTITLGLFSVVAMLLASIGLYGVLAYYVNQRTHEIGVRMSLGADVPRVVRHVLWRSAVMVVPGIAVGLAAALAGARFLQQLLFEVPPTDLATYAAVSACLAVVALAASVVPAWRAALIDPVTALRSE